MRVRGLLAAVVLAASVPAFITPAQAAAPTYRKVAAYDLGAGRITGIDVVGSSLYAMSSRRMISGGWIARFKLRTGLRVWRSGLECPDWGPQATDGVVFAQGAGCSAGIGAIVALQRSDGIVALATDAHSGVVSDDVAYLTAFGDPLNPGSGIVRAFDRKGLILWESDLGGQSFSLRILAAGDGAVYVADDLGVTALSDRDGRLLWHHNLGPIDSRLDIYGMAANGRLLLSGESDGGVGGGGSGPFTLAMDASTGEIVWTSDGRLGEVANGTEYEIADRDLARDGSLVARSMVDGSVVWRTDAANDRGFSNPMVDAGRVWVRAYDDAGTPQFLVYDATDGSALGAAPWQDVIGVSNGLVFVPRAGGRIVAFRAA
jgi:outer membrane protein assembly factor BamB